MFLRSTPSIILLLLKNICLPDVLLVSDNFNNSNIFFSLEKVFSNFNFFKKKKSFSNSIFNVFLKEGVFFTTSRNSFFVYFF